MCHNVWPIDARPIDACSVTSLPHKRTQEPADRVIGARGRFMLFAECRWRAALRTVCLMAPTRASTGPMERQKWGLYCGGAPHARFALPNFGGKMLWDC